SPGRPASVTSTTSALPNGAAGSVVIDGGPNEMGDVPCTELSVDERSSTQPAYPHGIELPSTAISGSLTVRSTARAPSTTVTSVAGPHSASRCAGSRPLRYVVAHWASDQVPSGSSDADTAVVAP